jgi:hypothetical protein
MKNIYSIEEMMGTDVSDFPSYINEVIDDKLSKIGQDLTQYHYYTITIDKQITRTNYHSFDMEKVQDISRKFTNGLSTLGSVTNRQFFSNHFVGGIKTTSIHQSSPEDYPVISLNYGLFSKDDNLDIRIKSQLTTRIKMIDHTLVPRIEYHGKFSRGNVMETIPNLTQVDYSSAPVKKLHNRTIQQIFDNNFQRPRYFGILYKVK